MEVLSSIFYFIVAIGILVTFHEFGHFIVARMLQVRVVKFSIGFGRTLVSYQKNPTSTEYVISLIPLGGYVKMLGEQGKVAQPDLPFAFNNKPLWARTAIVAAGPAFSLLLGVLFFWLVLMFGENGMRPVVAQPPAETLMADAGFQNGDEIITINGEATPIWQVVSERLVFAVMQESTSIAVGVQRQNGEQTIRHIQLQNKPKKPKEFFAKLGLKLWSPQLPPIIGKLTADGAAKRDGLQPEDLIISANGQDINDWTQWVKYIKSHPDMPINITLERDGVLLDLQLTPAKIAGKPDFGRIGAGVYVDPKTRDYLTVRYSLPPGEALVVATKRTWQYSTATLQMLGKMFIGKVSTDNLSGPIGIAQYAGKTAASGWEAFFKFMAVISISLGVLNLLPVPMLDGGHLLFFAIEAVKGSPVSPATQYFLQSLGVLFLFALMALAIFVDLERLLT